MTVKRLTCAGVATLVLGLGAGAQAAGAAPALDIDGPAAGAQVSRAATPQLDVTGPVSFVVPQAASRQFFIRRNACTEQWLSAQRGSETNGCAENSSFTPLNEVNRLPSRFDSRDGTPLTLDASRPISGVVTMSSFQQPAYAGGGQTIVDVAVSGQIDGTTQSLGSTTVEYVAIPTTAPTATAWSITPPAGVDKKDVTALQLSLTVRGVHMMHGYIRANESSMTVPTYSASFARRVEVAVGNGAFAPAALAEDLSRWTATVPTPAVGSHAIKARAIQGALTSAVAARTVEVTP